MGRCLAMFDLSGIQSFIFQTNRLKEIVGASYIVSRALFSNVPEILGKGKGKGEGEAHDAWKTRAATDFVDVAADEGKVVYIGGGNALVLFGSEDKATSFTKELKHCVFEQTGGALRICAAFCEVGENTRLADCLNPALANSLRNKLDRTKAKAPHALTARGFSINALDNDTSEPILYFEHPLYDRDGKRQFMGRSQYLKLQAYKEQHGNATKRPAQSPLLELMGNREYKDELEDFFKNDAGQGGKGQNGAGQGGKGQGDANKSDAAKDGANQNDVDENVGKRFVAVVHIDGNTMGQRIINFMKDTKTRCDSFEDDLIAMRDLSAYIGDLYKNALKQTIRELYGDVEGKLPFRPVVADGDDITYICKSDVALTSVRTFVEALHNPETSLPEGSYLPAANELGVGAGIALVNNNYPFSSAYAMAEELCKNAKKAARDRFGANPHSPISSVDFHVCSGEVITSIADFRKKYLEQRDHETGEDVSLCIRPYHIGDVQIITPSTLSYESFLQQVHALKTHSANDVDEKNDAAWIARSKLKGLRDKYGEGKSRAEDYGKFVVERDKAMRGSASGKEPERSKFVGDFGNPYEQLAIGGQSDSVWYARFFDALDVLDLCDGVGDAE